MRRTHAVIRAFRKTDRERVRAIFRETGQRGNPLRVYIEDDELVLRLLADYYMDHEPEWCFVAEVNGRVVAFVLGSKDPRKYIRTVVTRILPRLAARVLWKLLTGQYRERRTYETLWWCLARAWRELPRPPLDRYPAHCHLGIEDGYRHLFVGRELVDTLAHRLRAHGVPGVHGIALEEPGRHSLARVLGVKVLAARRTTVWDKCTGKRWDAKLIVREL